jgi:hypothetical protein
MRVADDRVRFAREVPLAADPPRRPAAVRLYDDDGLARCLAVDLDVKRSAGGGGGAGVGRRQVLADCERVLALARICGAPAFCDESPSGGRHVYLPLATPRTLDELRPVLRALGAVCPSMDPTPMLNPTAGCIRPPGAAHRFGGCQRLLTPLAQARAALARPAADAAWANLLARLAPHDPAPPPGGDGGGVWDGPGRDGGRADGGRGREGGDAGGPAPRPLPAAYEEIARTGDYPAGRYASRSEARLAVLCSAVWHGWTLADVRARLAAGAWPGLAGFYTRYSASSRPGALRRDWAKARRLRDCAAPSGYAPTREHVPNSHTSAPTTHGGKDDQEQNVTGGQGRQRSGRGTDDEYRFLRQWRTALELAGPGAHPGKAGLALRAVLAAVGAAAQKTGSRYVAFGTRSLSLEAGCDPTTVAAALRTLRAEPDPFLVLIENERGPAGDLYELRIPDRHADAAARLPWPKGHLHGVDVAFRAPGLGLPAYFAYRALDPEAPVTVAEVQGRAGISRSAAYRALDALADAGLARRVRGGWIRGRTALLLARERLGMADLFARLLERFRAERRRWWAFLGHVPAHAVRQVLSDASAPGAPPPRDADLPPPPGPEPPEPPGPYEPGQPDGEVDEVENEDVRAALDLLAAVLGAVPLVPEHPAGALHPAGHASSAA